MGHLASNVVRLLPQAGRAPGAVVVRAAEMSVVPRQ